MMNNENGRSMVEMLGVLAIIGVLSVAGIAGYSMAMRKYKANEITNAISMMAIYAQTQDSIPAAGVTYETAYSVTSAPAGATIKATGPKKITLKTGTDNELCTAVKDQLSGSFMTATNCVDGSTTITVS